MRWTTNYGPLQLLQLKSLGNSRLWSGEWEPRQPVTFPKWRRWSWEFRQSKVTRVNRTDYRKGENCTKKPGDLQWSPLRNSTVYWSDVCVTKCTHGQGQHYLKWLEVNTAGIVPVGVFGYVCIYISVGYMSRRGSVDGESMCIFTFSKCSKLAPPPMTVPGFYILFKACVVYHFYFSHSRGCIILSHLILICISLIATESSYFLYVHWLFHITITV